MTDTQTLDPSVAQVVTPPEGRFWLEDEMFALDKQGMHVPRFSVQEAAKSFFAEGADWLRWRMRADNPNPKVCHNCRGTGKINRRKCPVCKGEGMVPTPPAHPDGFFVLDGEPLEFKRLKVSPSSPRAGDPNAVTARYYTLADIERMAHALFQQGVIDQERLASIVALVRISAAMYGVPGVSLIEPVEAEPEPADA